MRRRPFRATRRAGARTSNGRSRSRCFAAIAESASAIVEAQNSHMLLDGVLSEDDVALLQDAIARATRVAAEQKIDIDQHDGAARLCEFLLGGEHDPQKMAEAVLGAMRFPLHEPSTLMARRKLTLHYSWVPEH